MEIGVGNMARKGIPAVYTPIDYNKKSFSGESQITMYGDSSYQKGWTEKEKSYPKLYYDASSPSNTKLTSPYSQSTNVQGKHKNVKSQVERVKSVKTDHGQRGSKIHMVVQKSKSNGVNEGKHGKRDEGSLYPELQNMIDTYSDNFGGHDGRKGCLYSDHGDRHMRKSKSDGFERGSYDNLRKSTTAYELSSHHNTRQGKPAVYQPVNYNSRAAKDDPDDYKSRHIPDTTLDLGVSELRKGRTLHHKPAHVPSLVTPRKVSPSKQESYGYDHELNSPVSPNIKSPTTSPPIINSSRKIPPPVKPKSKKVLNMKMFDENDSGRLSIPKLIDLCENILRKLKSWTETTKVVRDLTSQLEALVTLLLTSVEGEGQRKPSLTESIASALESFSFLGGDDENDSGDATPSHISRNKRPPYCRTLFHHLCGLHDLVDGFQPSAGPLRTRQNSYYEKMQQQNMIINQISQLIVDGNHISLMSVCDRFCETTGLAEVWKSSTADEHPMYCTREKMRLALDHHCPYLVDGENNNNDNYVNSDDIRGGVCSMVVKKICELDIYTTDQKVITVFQFVDFFKNQVRHYNVMEYMRKSIEEFLMLKVLFSKDELLVMSTLQQYRKIPVVKSCIHCLLSFLVGDKISRKAASLYVLAKIYENPENRTIMLNIMVASLEESNIGIKAGACIALGKLKVQGISKKLIYLHQTETRLVKEAAEEGLKDLGHNLIRR